MLNDVSSVGAALMASELAAEVPTFALRGRVVTMDEDQILDDGIVMVSEGEIRAVQPADAPLPREYSSVKPVHTRGTIYPGLIDLHNHYVYNVLRLWQVPRPAPNQPYTNRSQWPRHPEYRARISKPIREALARFSVTSKALVRYVEAKALIGGTTTGQGILTRVNGGSRAVFGGVMRNVEHPRDDHMVGASTRVPDLGTSEAQIAQFRRALESGPAHFYHLAEGVDPSAHRHFQNLQGNALLLPSLIGIHSLALRPEDFDTMAAHGCKVVWSPYSNLLLYGQTIDPNVLKASGVTFSIGCDWSPTGSKNLLQELKVAWQANLDAGAPFTAREIVAAVTSVAAKVAAWDSALGTLRIGAMADLLVIAGASEDPYTQLIAACEAHVQLVVVRGVARYGDPELLRGVHAGSASRLEDVSIAGTRKTFHLWSRGSLINDLSYAAARINLMRAMADLHAFVSQMHAQNAALRAAGSEPVEELQLELDEPVIDDVFTDYDADLGRTPALSADVAMADSVELDPPEVTEDDLTTIAAELNLPSTVKDALRRAYAR